MKVYGRNIKLKKHKHTDSEWTYQQESPAPWPSLILYFLYLTHKIYHQLQQMAILQTCKQTVLRSCAQHIRIFLNKWKKNRSNNGHTCYTCKVISRRAARTQTKYRRRCRLSNKQTIYRLLHPSPGAEIHGASQPLPSNGRLCIRQKSSATPTRPSVRHIIFAL
jgi:hypothetical protein